MASVPTRLPETAPLMWVDYFTLAAFAAGAACWIPQRQLAGAVAVIAAVVFLFARALAGRVPALLGAVGALLAARQAALPLELAVAALGVWWIWLSAERESTVLAVVAGAAVAVCSRFDLFTALTVVGVAAGWWLLARLRLCSGPKAGWLVALLLACAAIAVPLQGWEPHPLVVPLVDPASAFGPLPLVCLTSTVWLVVSTVRRRDGREALLALWLLSSPWSLVPIAFAAVAVVLRDLIALARPRPGR